MPDLETHRPPEPAPVTAPGADAAVRVATTPVDRSAAFAAGPEKIPRRIVVAFLAALVVLGVGGVVVDHFVAGPVGTSTTDTSAGAYPPPLPAPANTPASPGASSAVTPAAAQLPASLSALLGLTRTTPTAAPGFSLTDQAGHAVSLASLRGKVVVLSFFDAACDDICPVLAAELVQAHGDLGPAASRVALVTVDTDPLGLPAVSAAPAEAAAGISSLPDWYFLTGTLRQLDAVWKSYGVTVEVQPRSGLVSHNDVLDFIDPSGRVRLHATPFADESTAGVFGLPAPTEGRWATGIAVEARSLVGDAR